MTSNTSLAAVLGFDRDFAEPNAAQVSFSQRGITHGLRDQDLRRTAALGELGRDIKSIALNIAAVPHSKTRIDRDADLLSGLLRR